MDEFRINIDPAQFAKKQPKKEIEKNYSEYVDELILVTELIEEAILHLDNASVIEENARCFVIREELVKLQHKVLSITQRPEIKSKTYLCTICKKVPVDAENGYDTCSVCLSEQ